jgi:uncharacterized tellurite resistance protein B-like protein
MFIHYLNSEQQSALYYFSKQLVVADGHVDERETILLDTIVNQCDENVDLNKSFNIYELSALFSDNPPKIAFLIELIGVGYADQVFEQSEDSLIKQVAVEIGVEPKKIEELKNWVQRQMALVLESKLLLGV